MTRKGCKVIQGNGRVGRSARVVGKDVQYSDIVAVELIFNHLELSFWVGSPTNRTLDLAPSYVLIKAFLQEQIIVFSVIFEY